LILRTATRPRRWWRRRLAGPAGAWYSGAWAIRVRRHRVGARGEHRVGRSLRPDRVDIPV